MSDTEQTMKRISVMIPSETRAALDRIVAENQSRGWSQSTVVREALADFVQKSEIGSARDANRIAEDWPSPLMVARAAGKLWWPARVCRAIRIQWTTSALDPYEIRYLKAVRAGRDELLVTPIPERGKCTIDDFEELARPFEDELEGGDE